MPDMIENVDNVIAAALRALPDVRGKANLALRLRNIRERRSPLDGTWKVRLSEGSEVCLPRSSRMSWTVAVTGQWDRHLIAEVARYVRPETLVLDVGASIGMWTVPLARTAAEHGALLWCFEPNPDNVRWLTMNIERNGLDGVVHVQPVGLGSSSSQAYLGLREHGGGNGAVQDCGSADTIAITVCRLDDIPMPRPISFIKLDVEGFELEVLRGGWETIRRDRPVIFGEFSTEWLRIRGENLPAYLCKLADIGYAVFTLQEERSAAWRAKDIVDRKELLAPFDSPNANLLLVPSHS